jgi:hypothetical protein
MSQLNIKLNLSTRQWTIQEVDIASKYVDALFGFTGPTMPIEFNNLSFGLILQKDNSIIYHTTFPKVGSTYKSTNLDFIEIFRIDGLIRNAQYNVTLWANNDEITSETTYVLNTPNVPDINDYEVV